MLKKIYGLFAIGAIVSMNAQAQQYGAVDISTAKSGAMKVQIEQFETTVKQLQDTLVTLNTQVQNQEASLNAVKNKVNDPTKGVDAINTKIQGAETRVPQLVSAKVGCSTGSTGQCQVHCEMSALNPLNANYEKIGRIMALDAYVTHGSGSYDINFNYATCKANTRQVCVKKEQRREPRGCNPRSNNNCRWVDVCTQYKTEYVPTSCNVICAGVGYKK